MAYQSIRDLDLNGKRVFIRVDFNVPLEKNAQGVMEITSDKRIKASLPTIKYALEHGAGLVLASHLGRPKGKPNADMSLKPVAARLERGVEVELRRQVQHRSDDAQVEELVVGDRSQFDHVVTSSPRSACLPRPPRLAQKTT